MDKGLSDALSQVLLDNAFEAKEPSEAEKDSLLKADFMLLCHGTLLSVTLWLSSSKTVNPDGGRKMTFESLVVRSHLSLSKSLDDLFVC